MTTPTDTTDPATFADFDPAAVAAAITGDTTPTPLGRGDLSDSDNDPTKPGTYDALVRRAPAPARDVAFALDVLPASDVAALRTALAAYERERASLVAIADEAHDAADEIAAHRKREHEAVTAAASGAKVTRPKPLDADALRFAADVRHARARAVFAAMTPAARAVDAEYDALAESLRGAVVARIETAGQDYAAAVDALRAADDAQARAVHALVTLYRIEAAQHPDPKVRTVREGVVRSWQYGLDAQRPTGALPDSETPLQIRRLAARAMTGDYLAAIAAGPGPLPTGDDDVRVLAAGSGGVNYADVPPGFTE